MSKEDFKSAAPKEPWPQHKHATLEEGGDLSILKTFKGQV
jgi:hypothetical protein